MRSIRIVVALALLGGVGCAADDYAEAGKAWEGRQPLAALEYYRLALDADPEHPLAGNGAENHAYQTLTALLDQAAAQGGQGEWVAAVGLLDQAAAVFAALRACGVQVEAADLEQAYPAALQGAAQQRFADGEGLRARNKPKEASIAYRESLAFDPTHTEAQTRYDEQRAEATERLAIMPFACDLPEHPGAGRALADEVTAQALALKPEFLRFVDRANLDRLLDELDLNDTGLVDPETAAREGKLLGVSSILLGELTVTGEDSGWEHTPNKVEQDVEVDDGKGGKRKEKRTAEYTVSERSVHARVVVGYRVISAETGEVLAAANGLASEASDGVRYARLRSGDAKAVPEEDRKLLLETEREPRTFEELARAAFDQLGQVVAQDLVERFP